MPRYFFHVLTTDGMEPDRDGIDFSSLELAENDARISLFEMMAEDLAKGHHSKIVGIDITDQDGNLISAVTLKISLKH